MTSRNDIAIRVIGENAKHLRRTHLKQVIPKIVRNLLKRITIIEDYKIVTDLNKGLNFIVEAEAVLLLL